MSALNYHDLYHHDVSNEVGLRRFALKIKLNRIFVREMEFADTVVNHCIIFYSQTTIFFKLIELVFIMQLC